MVEIFKNSFIASDCSFPPTKNMGDFEQLISNILIPDSNIIKENTAKLKEALKHPDSITNLCQLICTSSNPMVRQYASVLLRNKIKVQWKSLKAPEINIIQESLIKALFEENEKLPLTMACNAMGVITKHRLEMGQWNDFFSLIHGLIDQDVDATKRERGCFILSELLPSIPLLFTTRHLAQFTDVFTKVLADGEKGPMSAYYITKGINIILPSFTDTEEPLTLKWGQLIGKNISAITKVDEEKAAETLDFYTSLIECDLVDNPSYLQGYTNTFLEMASNANNSTEIRIKALSFVTLMVTLKKKVLLKLKMLDRILETVLPLYGTVNDEDEDDEEFYEEETYQSSLLSASSEVIEEMAVNVSPGKFMPTVIKFVESYVSDQDHYKQRGAYLVLSSVVNGCPQYIKEKYLDAFIQCVLSGMKSDYVIVKKAAFHALSNFSEVLQPEIMSYHMQIMPLLFDQVGRLTSSYSESNENALTRAFCAFETYIENMEKEILEPYLPIILQNLMAILRNESLPIRVKELAASSISSTACAAEDLIEPYFPDILTILEKYLVSESSDYDKLQIQSIDALNMFSRCLRKEYFAPVAQKCLEFSVKMLETKQDPDLKSVIYGLLGGISGLMKDEMKPYLPVILPHMLSSITSTAEMMQVKEDQHDKEAITKIFDAITKPSNNDDIDVDGFEDVDSDDDKSDASCAVENAYIEEKENALLHMGEIAYNLGEAFVPHLQPIYVKILPMIEHVYIDVQVEAVKCLANFCCCLGFALCPAKPDGSASPNTTADSTGAVLAPPKDSGALFAFNMVTYECITKFLDTINNDENRDVVIAALEAITLIFTNGPAQDLSTSSQLDPVATVLKKVIRKRVKCQKSDNQMGDDKDGCDEGDDEDEDVELDQLVIQTAYEAIPGLARVLGPQRFMAQHFNFFMERIHPKLDGSEGAKNGDMANSEDAGQVATTNDKSMLLGVLADVVKEVGPAIAPKSELLYDIFMHGLYDSDAEVKSNAVYGLGRLLEAIGDLFQEFPVIVFKLGGVLKSVAQPITQIHNGHGLSDTNVNLASNLMLRDNVVAALSRLIKIPSAALPFPQIMELIIPNLPLTKDMTENENVYSTLKFLWESYNAAMTPYVPQLISIALKALFSGKVKEGGEKALGQLVVSLYRTQRIQFDTACSTMTVSDQQKNILDALLRSTA